MIRTFATLTLALPAFAAMAQNTDYSALYDKCVESNGPITNTVVHMCSESVSTKAKAEMNKLYKQVYERLSQQSADDADKLERTQKSWLAYRNGQCELAGSHVGSPMYDFCPMQLNVQRVAELRELAGQ